MPEGGTAFVSVKDGDKGMIVQAAQILDRLGFNIIATGGTCAFLREHGVRAERINKVYEGRPHIVDRMKDGHITLVFNTTEGAQAIRDSFDLRRTALINKIPYYTTVAGICAATQGIAALKAGGLEVEPLQSYFSGNF